MEQKSYQIETEDNKDCVRVFVENDSEIENVASIIKSFFFIGNTKIEYAVNNSKHSVLKAISVYPNADITIQDKVVTIQDLKLLIKDVLNDGELLKNREYISKTPDVLTIYDKIILKLFWGFFDENIIEDMHSVWNGIICHQTGVVSTYHSVLLKAIIKLSGKSSAAELYRTVYIDSVNPKMESLKIEITRLFAATNEFIKRMYK